MLAIRPRLASHARLEHAYQQEGAEWRLSSATLKLVKGLPLFVGVQPLVADFLSSCDGTRTLRELIETLATRVDRPIEVVQPECLQMARTLLERGFLEWQNQPVPFRTPSSVLTKE